MPKKITPAEGIAPINRWVVDAMNHANISGAALSKAMHERRVISSNDRSIPSKIAQGHRGVSIPEALAIAEITGFTEDIPGAEATLAAPAMARSGATPPYAGIVQAGAFRDVDEYFNQDPEAVPDFVLRDPNYPKARQYAWQAKGDSMNEAGILDGMWVVGADAADYIDTYGDIASGDLVVVERTRHQGSERELTVKEVHFFRDRYELRPVSSNLSHKAIVVPHDHTESDVEVKIIGVVLTAYANLRKRR